MNSIANSWTTFSADDEITLDITEIFRHGLNQPIQQFEDADKYRYKNYRFLVDHHNFNRKHFVGYKKIARGFEDSSEADDFLDYQLEAHSHRPKLWFSALIASHDKYQEDFLSITRALNESKIDYSLLNGTKDIWCRDYMPVRRPDGQLIQFEYERSYPAGSEHLRSDVRVVNNLHNLNPIDLDINLAGGDVLIRGNKALVSDRVIRENPQFEYKRQLLDLLKALFEAEILFVPEVKSDMTGHIDGYALVYG